MQPSYATSSLNPLAKFLIFGNNALFSRSRNKKRRASKPCSNCSSATSFSSSQLRALAIADSKSLIKTKTITTCSLMFLDILPARTTLQLSLLSTCHSRVAQPKRCFALRTVSTIQTSPFSMVELLSLSLRSRLNGLEYRFLLKDNRSTKEGVRRRPSKWAEVARRT